MDVAVERERKAESREGCMHAVAPDTRAAQLFGTREDDVKYGTTPTGVESRPKSAGA